MKPIVLTQEAKDNALEIFKKLLNDADANTDLKINITTETLLLEQGVEKPTVFVLASAYIKMMALIKSSTKELAWYGIATRAGNNYLIEDILVYPQTVTSTTVDADEEKCAKWFMKLPDDVINNLKFQGHSHVGMSASPSGRDTNNWQKFANLLKPGEFYILCIGNNKGEFYWNIYDKAINVLFENKDITMAVVDTQGNSLNDWAKESIDKHIVDTSKSATVRTFNGTGYTIIPDNSSVPTNSTAKTKTKSKKDNALYLKGLEHIPAEFKGDIDYDPDEDVYYTDVIGLPAFVYSHLFNCYMCPGFKFRAAYALKGSTENKTKKTKKENKKQTKEVVKS